MNVAALPSETTATARYPVPRETDPPPTAIYHANPVPPPPIGNQRAAYQPPNFAGAIIHTDAYRPATKVEMPFGGF